MIDAKTTAVVKLINNDLDEGQLAEANEQLAETGQIEDYGAIYECYFEK